MRPSVNVTSVQRVGRLLFLVGVAIAAYFALCIFDHAARADVGVTDHLGASDRVASVESVAADAKKALPEPKSTAAKARPQTFHRSKVKEPTIRAPEVRAPEVRAPEVRAPKVRAPKVRAPRTPQVVAKTAIRPVQTRISKLRQRSSDVVRDAVSAAATRTHAAVVQLTSLTQLPGLPHTQLPGLPQTHLPALTHPIPAETNVPALTPLLSGTPGLHQRRTPQAPELCGVAVPPATPELPGSAGQPSIESNQVDRAQPRTMPRPTTPRRPVDHSTPTGQARDSGGGSSPATGTVPSSWRPEMTAAARPRSTDLIACGRTVRYAGPPS